MAERKSSIARAPKRPDLEKLLEKNRQSEVSDEVLAEQRVSFAYGNRPKGSRITKASARSAAKSMRLVHA